MSCPASDSPLVAIVSDPKPSSLIAVGIFIDKYKAPYEVGVEPTNDGYEPSAITNLAIRSLLLVPFIKVADRSSTSQLFSHVDISRPATAFIGKMHHPSGTWTHDTEIFSLLFYQLNYRMMHSQDAIMIITCWGSHPTLAWPEVRCSLSELM